MRIILIDDYGDTRIIDDNDGPLQSVMDAAKENGFSLCGVCGIVVFDDEYVQFSHHSIKCGNRLR